MLCKAFKSSGNRIFVCVAFCLLLFSIQCQGAEKDDNEFRKLILHNLVTILNAQGREIGIRTKHAQTTGKMVIYIDNYDKIITVSCKQVEFFSLVKLIEGSSEKHEGSLLVGLCPAKKQLGGDVIDNIENRIGNAQVFKKLNEDQMREYYLFIDKEQINDGSTLIYYPMTIFGHGMAVTQSYMLFPPDERYSLILQFTTAKVADNNNPISDAVRRNIKEIALGIMQGVYDLGYE